ncbi:uncharacterized protein LOC126567092 [Anopheles maculipalpis]|uniref:uncharacterized protein LOC126567092 n=1 Tax=Anopheles maculipalpis TaxID=1496333 RepID=UPI0021597F1B|nr:uncharacterized protein LOC126567092 [Anopheles maculipalpis]
MGNSGSLNGLLGYEEGYHHHPGYHHDHQRYHEAMRCEPVSGMSSSWIDSYQRDHHRRGVRPRDHEQQQQIKVLPDIPGKVAKLRSTSNGSILHAGGTISKNNQTLQRSKSISSPTNQQHQQQKQKACFSECEDLEMNSLHPCMLMQRSRTQLHLMPQEVSRGGSGSRPRNRHSYNNKVDEDGGAGAPDKGSRQATHFIESNGAANVPESLNHRKRFGSEPDLRLSLLPRNGQQLELVGGRPRNPKMTQLKIMKGKNKKKAPVPPIMERLDSNKDAERQRIIAFSPMRKPGSDTNAPTPTSSSDGNFNVGTTRKLRLFKTRAETKKTPTIAKLPEASDAKFPGKHGPSNGPGGGFMRSVVPLQPTGSEPHTIIGHSHRNDSALLDDEKLATALDQVSARPNPTSFFRREKTFDAGLLGLERLHEIEPRSTMKSTMSPPLSRRKSIVKSYLAQDTPSKSTTTIASNRMDLKTRQQVGTPAESYQRKLALAEAQRKQSSAATTAITDFQKELQLAAGNTDTNNSSSPTLNRTGAGQTKPVRSGGGTEHITSLLPTVSGGKSKPALSNALVINVEPAKELDQGAVQSKPDQKLAARESPPPSTPPPPPPPPKTSFYFGMRGDRRPPSDTPLRFSDRKHFSPSAAPFASESRVDDSGSERDCETRRGSRTRHDIDGQPVEEIGHTRMVLIDQFTASLLSINRFRSYDSVASSQADIRTGPVRSWDESDSPGHQEIALKLRPTLPRKQFDIPRFSPAAAWRLLMTEDEFCRGAPIDVLGRAGEGGKKSFLRCFDQDVLDVPEDRIQRVYREPVLGLQDNKSGDSGISGDAGILADIGHDALLASTGKEERAGDTSPESRTQLHKGGGASGTGANGGWSSNALVLMPWTPQQDLGDDEDENEEEEDEQEDHATTGSASEHRRLLLDGSVGTNDDTRPKFSNKGHLFSLSLPRENHLSIYNVEEMDEKVEKYVFNSLQTFRKSVSGLFKTDDSNGQLDSNDRNWFLGRFDTTLSDGTGPGSGSEKHSKLLLPDGRTCENTDSVGGATVSIGVTAQNKHNSIRYLVSGKHMMYLPKEPTELHAHTTDKNSKQDENNNRKSYQNQNGSARHDKSTLTSSEVSTLLHRNSAHRAINGGTDKENLQDPVSVAATSTHASKGELENFPVKLSNRRNHRFTFQSTIRQIEKRRVAEKLSREAEIKEAMRLSELEAMRRVEEEFQKKRAREKASIRHQLRLFSLENHPDQHHAPSEGDVEQDSTGETKRSDPDGDSLPHQSALGRSGIYRKKEFNDSGSMERQYKRPNGTATTVTNSNHNNASTADDDMYLGNEMEMEQVTRGGRRRYEDEYDDDDGDVESSSLGYVDTRTPYISRIIQAKSSKSYAMKK